MPLSGKKKRWIWRVIWLALLLALFSLNYYMAHRTPKNQFIGALKPWQAFSRVQVQGILLAPARELKSGGWFGQLADESGTVFLFIKKWPTAISKEAGTRLLAQGRLIIKTGHGMSVQASTITSIPKTPITLRGRIAALKTPASHVNVPYRIRLENSSQPLEIVFWFSPSQSLSTGMVIEATGILGVYKEQLQLQLQHPKNIHIIDP
jgi:hypothetical protein